MLINEKTIGELEKKLLGNPKITPRQKAFMIHYMAEAKKKGKENYFRTLLRYARKYLDVIPSQGTIPGITIEKRGCVNAAQESQGFVRGLVSKASILANASIGSQGTIKGLREKKRNKGSENHAIPPQGKIKGIR